MAITNHERVGKALELLKAGLTPFVEREFKAKFGDGWAFEMREALSISFWVMTKTMRNQDVAALLVVMGSQVGRCVSSNIGQDRAQPGEVN